MFSSEKCQLVKYHLCFRIFMLTGKRDADGSGIRPLKLLKDARDKAPRPRPRVDHDGGGGGGLRLLEQFGLRNVGGIMLLALNFRFSSSIISFFYNKK